MNKADLINAVTEEMKLTHNRAVSKADVESLLSSLSEVATKQLANGADFTLPGMGKFSVGVRAARTGRNPQTGEPIDIPASRNVRFKAIKALKDSVN